ncbi:hypothetical protein [Streptococcus cristatus]|uniref:hypothetical protein n=1 Tax=Streptococcus cristatus TaxID=45634 RepID=UPI0028ECE05D|nr:hypothetical protein [Streptococcus cristatus]
MGYTELGRKRPIEIQSVYYDKILVYQHQGEIWGVCYKHGEIDCVYNYTKNDFFCLEISDMSLKEIVTKIIQPLKRSYPGAYSINEETFSRILEEIKK